MFFSPITLIRDYRGIKCLSESCCENSYKEKIKDNEKVKFPGMSTKIPGVYLELLEFLTFKIEDLVSN